ncbi:hypothetical protein HAX54_027424 [Datura stramonium]|uniref:Uncharacterized protein n=1 Tax=Datura stramonium TaxID=4076 RepID=A0ABS8S8P5_DATST|nr:hypothetical protein [Datura stramonium]
MGANQFNKPKDQGIFFNWFFFFLFGSSVVASTAIVYVEDNVSWKVGFFICVAANVLSSAIFLLGTRFYINSKPEGSPFTNLARVVVATIRKRKLPLPSMTSEDFYHGRSHVAPKAIAVAPSTTFTPSSLSNGPPHRTNFQIPAGSVLVFVVISTALFLALFDKFLFPTWRNLTGKSLTPLQRIGIGHVLSFLSMGVSALVESKRLKVAKSNQGSNNIVPMSVLWLVPQLALVGIANALHYPGQVVFYYQEFPATLKNMATSMILVIAGVAFYLTTALIDAVRMTTKWLPGKINNGRLDNVYWILGVGGVLNFGFYVTCSWFYKYQNMKEVDHNGSTSDE